MLNITTFINEKTCDVIKNKVNKSSILGCGTWSNVYNFKIGKDKVAVKVQDIEKGNYEKKENKKILRNLDVEIYLLKTLSDYEIENKSGMFPLFYGSKLCDNTMFIFYEKFNCCIDVLFRNNYNFIFFKKLLHKMFNVVKNFQEITCYYHGDVNYCNFLIKGDRIVLIDYGNSYKIDSSNYEKNCDIIYFKERAFKNIMFYVKELSIKHKKEKELVSEALKYSELKTDPKRRYKKLEESAYVLIDNDKHNSFISDVLKLKFMLPTLEMLLFIQKLPENIYDVLDFL